MNTCFGITEDIIDDVISESHENVISGDWGTNLIDRNWYFCGMVQQ